MYVYTHTNKFNGYSLIKKIQRTSEAHISAPLLSFLNLYLYAAEFRTGKSVQNNSIFCFLASPLIYFLDFLFFFCPRYSVGNSLSQHLVEADHQSQHFPASVHRGENDGLSYLHFLIIYTRHPCTTSARILVSPNLHCIF